MNVAIFLTQMLESLFNLLSNLLTDAINSFMTCYVVIGGCSNLIYQSSNDLSGTTTSSDAEL